jgi:pSer/pThr/pTyr-binding forkhead associated (FHA) protein
LTFLTPSFALSLHFSPSLRDASCDFVLPPSIGVDERHFSLQLREKGTVLLQNHSTLHPVLLNGQPLKDVRQLQDGDSFGISTTRFRWRSDCSNVVQRKELQSLREQLNSRNDELKQLQEQMGKEKVEKQILLHCDR